MAETQSREQSPLQTDRGATTINDAVVVSIASTAVQEVSGAEPEIATGRGGGSIPGDNSPTVGEFLGRFTGGGGGSRGVRRGWRDAGGGRRYSVGTLRQVYPRGNKSHEG